MYRRVPDGRLIGILDAQRFEGILDGQGFDDERLLSRGLPAVELHCELGFEAGASAGLEEGWVGTKKAGQ
jgi:hypothetical protein